MTTANLPVLYSAAGRCIIDYMLPTGLTAYGRETLEQTRTRYPDAVLMTQADASKAQDDAYKVAPKLIDLERFWNMLEVLPPCRWNRGGVLEYFHVSERICGDVVSWFARWGRGDAAVYIEFADTSRLNHDELAHIVRNAVATLSPATSTAAD